MPTTRLGPGTLTIGDTMDVSTYLKGARIKTNVNQDDPVTYLAGNQEPGTITFDSEFTGTIAADVDLGDASVFEYSYAHKGETVPFEYSPRTGVVTFTGELVITPLDGGADEYGAVLDSEFTWPIVGEVDRTYGSGTPATGATAGSPGTWTPSGATPPADLVACAGVTASPATAWTTGQHVITGDTQHVHWSGSAWATGDAA